MAIYHRGSKGDEVRTIQTRLQELCLYHGPLDGDFGGGTESAVRRFQRAEGLGVDGVVGSNTWKALFPQEEEAPPPSIAAESLARRCLGLTGSFETGRPVPECFAGLSGDFDGQGISFGALQWNLGQGSLQPILRDLIRDHRTVAEEVFDDYLLELEAMLDGPHEEQLAWARSQQDPRRHRLYEPWQGLLKTLGRRPEYHAVQESYARLLYEAALELCRDYGLWSRRAVALMFDIKVQNGSISRLVRAQIQQDFAALPEELSREEAEEARLRIVANRRAEAANPRWVEDVRRRKLTLAEGRGTVHGIPYDLREQYGIDLTEAAELRI